MPRHASSLVTALTLAVTLAACTASPAPMPQPGTETIIAPTFAPTVLTTPSTAPPAPAWKVGATPLPLRTDGFGKVLPTPPVLANRNLPTEDLLPPPAGDRYAATVIPVPADVLARSTWDPKCPVTLAELRYLTMSFRGYDGRTHTGEMIVNARFADKITTVFRALWEAKFPLEAMRVTSRAELDAPPTGDGNTTSAFVCRPTVGQTTWSAHAYGLAIDVNPFCNPYIKGDLVLPELASSYLDRRDRRPGMIFPGDVTVKAFAAIGWSWGGDWKSPRDLQHFTATGH